MTWLCVPVLVSTWVNASSTVTVCAASPTSIFMSMVALWLPQSNSLAGDLAETLRLDNQGVIGGRQSRDHIASIGAGGDSAHLAGLTCVSVTEASGTIAPEGSVMVPRSVANP